MKKYRHVLLTLSLGLLPLLTFAVTEKEMEQARATAAKYYLRYVNNGSDYLDKLNPSSVSELEKSLKEKEKKNIVAFKNIKIPSDYSSWDKAKLVEFWSVTALKTSGLEPKGKEAQWKIKSSINSMKISEPKKEEPKKEEPKKEEPKKEEPKKEEPKKEEPKTAQSAHAAEPLTVENVEATDSALNQAENAAMATLDGQDNEEPKKEGSHTWVYIMVLAILIAIVIGLVVFASNLMKKDSMRAPVRQREEGDDRDYDEMEEHLNQIIDEKSSEINMLSKKLESANRQNTELKQKLESLTIEISRLRDNIERDKAERKAEVSREEYPRETVRSIYLGRANSKGIFVRADRKLNPGNSIFKLETKDGVSGTFKVVSEPEVWDVALRLPREYLSFACLGPQLEDSSGASKIVNDSAGTAVFEGGCWRVTRKARIHYE